MLCGVVFSSQAEAPFPDIDERACMVYGCLRIPCGNGWQADRSLAEVMQQREEMISKLEEANATMWDSGKRAEWFQLRDAITKGVSAGVNGFLLQELLCASGHCDLAAADLFREGERSHACVANCRVKRRCLLQVLTC